MPVANVDVAIAKRGMRIAVILDKVQAIMGVLGFSQQLSTKN